MRWIQIQSKLYGSPQELGYMAVKKEVLNSFINRTKATMLVILPIPSCQIVLLDCTWQRLCRVLRHFAMCLMFTVSPVVRLTANMIFAVPDVQLTAKRLALGKQQVFDSVRKSCCLAPLAPIGTRCTCLSFSSDIITRGIPPANFQTRKKINEKFSTKACKLLANKSPNRFASRCTSIQATGRGAYVAVCWKV